MKDMFKDIEESINKSQELSRDEKNTALKDINKLRERKINLLITGATGSGKSSTINAMFNADVAKVGTGVDPETMDIKKFELDNLTIWDSPGLGDGKENDIRHSKGIIKKITEIDEKTNRHLIDLVVVLVDGSSRDLGTTYQLINSVIVPNLGDDAKKRIIIAINKVDMLKSGRGWDHKNNKPTEPLVKFMNEKKDSVQRRIKEGTAEEGCPILNIEPICYCAGYKDDLGEQLPWNLSKLFLEILRKTPKDKRLLYINNQQEKPAMWEHNDELENYRGEIMKSIMESVQVCATGGAAIGAAIAGPVGAKVGGIIGAVIGGVVGFVSSWF